MLTHLLREIKMGEGGEDEGQSKRLLRSYIFIRAACTQGGLFLLWCFWAGNCRALDGLRKGSKFTINGVQSLVRKLKFVTVLK